MSQDAIDAMALAATKRLREYINRMAAQHQRRMVEGWRKAA